MVNLMKKRKFIGFMTVLSGVPGLIGIPLLFSIGITESPIIVIMAILAFIFRGICGVVGGVQLWRGKKIGYILSSIMWAYMVIVGLIASYQLSTEVFAATYEFSVENNLFWSAFGKILGKLIWGVPFLYILITDLKKHRIVATSN